MRQAQWFTAADCCEINNNEWGAEGLEPPTSALFNGPKGRISDLQFLSDL